MENYVLSSLNTKAISLTAEDLKIIFFLTSYEIKNIFIRVILIICCNLRLGKKKLYLNFER